MWLRIDVYVAFIYKQKILTSECILSEYTNVYSLKLYVKTCLVSSKIKA